jgi:hypothetical protein
MSSRSGKSSFFEALKRRIEELVKHIVMIPNCDRILTVAYRTWLCSIRLGLVVGGLGNEDIIVCLQYVAGVGNDPREGWIFNLVKQVLDFDPKGEYIRAWVQELPDVNLGEPNKERGSTTLIVW